MALNHGEHRLYLPGQRGNAGHYLRVSLSSGSWATVAPWQTVIEAPTWVTAVGGLPGSEPLPALHPSGQWTSVLSAVITCGIGME